MGAGGADREHLPTTAGEQDLFIADLANQHRAIGEITVREFHFSGRACRIGWVPSCDPPATANATASTRRALAGQQLLQDHAIVTRQSSDIITAHFS